MAKIESVETCGRCKGSGSLDGNMRCTRCGSHGVINVVRWK